MSANGRAVTRFTLIATLIVSITANITHAVLADSTITLFLRVPGAAIWPVLTFLAIEIIVRNTWAHVFTHYLARVFVLGPAIPAVIVSYEHQNSLLTMVGEKQLTSVIGPVAIDGMMIGCTLTLLFTRVNALDLPVPPIVKIPSIAPPPSPLIVTPARKMPARTPRPSSEIDTSLGGVVLAIDALKSGQTISQVVESTGLSAPTVRKYAAVIRTLRKDPNDVIDARRMSVRADLVDDIREWAKGVKR